MPATSDFGDFLQFHILVGIFGVASTSILSIAIYIYCLVHLLQKEGELAANKIIGER